MSESVFLRVRRKYFRPGAGTRARKQFILFHSRNTQSLSSENLTWNRRSKFWLNVKNWQKERVKSSAAANQQIPKSLIYNFSDVRISNQRYQRHLYNFKNVIRRDKWILEWRRNLLETAWYSSWIILFKEYAVLFHNFAWIIKIFAFFRRKNVIEWIFVAKFETVLR